MKNTKSACRISVVITLALALFLPPFAFAQGGQTPQAPPPNRTPGGGGQPGGNQPNTMPTDQPTQTQQDSGLQRPIFLSGSVRLADGSIPPDIAVIERVCNGVIRPEAYTDSRGNFSFQLGVQDPGMIVDASVPGNDPFSPNGSSVIGGLQQGVNERDVAGCEIRAKLAGFQSDSIMLGFRRSLDDPNIGTIRLHPIAKVQGFTYSATTGQAPKDARKAYEKGLEHIKKRKWKDAERELEKAVKIYPQYAVGWYQLGLVYQQQRKVDDATHAYGESLKADAKFVSPYGQLAALAAYQQKWDDVVKYTSEMLSLNPFEPPDIYFYSAVANYNLQNMDVAEDHAREAAKLDTEHKIPRINHLLATILAQQQDYAAAAENLRIYLKFSPDAQDADTVKQFLADLEKATAGEK